ncbi:MAG: CIA30 family protein [Halioglobus sp.]
MMNIWRSGINKQGFSRYFTLKLLASFLFLMVFTLPLAADKLLIDDFESQPDARWRFFADTVMGGVSTGQISFLSENGTQYARITGKVSTENNGGFIQIRTDLSSAPEEEIAGVRLIVRGNNQQYFVHLRTRGTVLPWQYYQSGFLATEDWIEVQLPLASFQASGRMLRKIPKAQSLKSVAVVAFGRDHDAEIDVREIGFY